MEIWRFPDLMMELCGARGDDCSQSHTFRRKTPDNAVPGATVLNTVPNFLTLSCRISSRWSDSSVSTTIS